jgi:hypothetical protein
MKKPQKKKMSDCKAEECNKPARNSGLCWAHYKRRLRYGDLNFRQRRANGEGQIYRGHFLITRNEKQVGEHVLIAERALGRPLPKAAVVHHSNENGLDNRNSNLVICENQGYHNIIHGRLNAFKATGDPHKKPCRVCHQYDDRVNLTKNGTSHYHKSCNTEYYRIRRALTLEV